MNQNIITYLNENKEKYSKDALIVELKKVGYVEGDIAEGVAQVFGLPAVAGVKEGLPAPAKTSFWNFKDKKSYTKASEKWADFLFGIFAALFIGVVMRLPGLFLRNMTPVFGVLGLILWVIVLVHVFKHRRAMFYGMVVSVLVLPVVLMVLIVAMFSSHGF
jgi:hypothetical protein